MTIEEELRSHKSGWWERVSRLIPELNTLAGTQQPQKYHAEGDVAVHTRLAVESCPHDCDADLLWAALLHDIGKPSTTVLGADGSITAHGHDKVGAGIAEQTLNRLGMPQARKERIIWAVKHHLFHHSWQLKSIDDASKKHKKFVAVQDFPLLLELIKVDSLASKGRSNTLATYRFYKEFRQKMEAMSMEAGNGY